MHGLFLKRHINRVSTTKVRRHEISQSFVIVSSKTTNFVDLCALCVIVVEAGRLLQEKTMVSRAVDFTRIISYSLGDLSNFFGGLAQLVEQRNHNPSVAGSSPPAATIQKARKIRKYIEFNWFSGCFTVSCFPVWRFKYPLSGRRKAAMIVPSTSP